MKNSITFIVLVIFCLPTIAQENLNKEVDVVKPYEPTISDAFKINNLPEIEEVQRIDPEFDYYITPKKMMSDFQVRPINAAKMVPASLSQYYKSYLKLGFGNYVTPMGELSINSLRSKKTTYGLNIRHQSSNGKLKLANDKKVFAGYGNSSIDVFGKRIYRNAVLTGDLSLNTNTVYYYGYNPELDTTLEKSSIKQNFLRVGAGATLKSVHKDSSHLNYLIDLNYQYFQDLESNMENAVHVDVDLNKLSRNKRLWGTKAEAHIFIPSENLDTVNRVVARVNPYLSRNTSEYRFKLGVNAFADVVGDETKLKLYPQALLEFNIIPKIMIPYLGIEGYLNPNNYATLVQQNKFITPGLIGKTTNYRLDFYVGIKGNFSSDISYNLGGSFDKINDLPLFVNDTISELQNQFMIEYDDVERQQVSAEIGYLYSENLNFLFNISYSEYNMKNEEHPWHKPTLNYSFRTFYNLSDKILINFDILGEGRRYAKMYKNDDFESIQLDGIVNVNLGVEYRYSKVLSGFINTKNLFGSRYYKWNHYPSQRFFIMAGFTYSL
jgi:hypothetical protein